MTITKSFIAERFNKSLGELFLLNNFNSRKKQWNGQKGFVDHTIVGKNCIYLIEVKIGKDEIKDARQYALMSAINDNILLCTEYNYELIISYILNPDKEILNILMNTKAEYCLKYLKKKQ